MGYNRFYSSAWLHLLLLVVGVSLFTVGLCRSSWFELGTGGGACMLSYLVYLQRQRELREKCWLMLEAIRNCDYSFRLPVDGLRGSERILQNTLNEFGGWMSRQKQWMEQRERFYELILANVTSGIVVLDEDQKILQTNPAAVRLLDLPTLATLQQLERYGNHLPQVFRSLPAGESTLVQFTARRGEVSLQVRASAIQVGGRWMRILSLNDIRSEMDAKELESWMKLTRVLTHEIMNSIAPISSLSDVFLHREEVRQGPLYDGIRAIHDTSVGLISFVDSYRKFSSLQPPSPEPFYLSDLLQQIRELHMVPDSIVWSQQIEPMDLMLYADPNLIRQVFINLLKNAVQAIGDQPGRIHLRAFCSSDEHIFIYVSNNGPVIPEAEAGQVFVPFFTTKTEGTGIGLSLVRQIMKLSHGSISLMKPGTNGWNTTFVLEFV